MVYETNSRFCSNSFIHQVLGTEMWREISNTHQPCVFDFPFSLHLKLSLYLCVCAGKEHGGFPSQPSVSESKANVQGKEAYPGECFRGHGVVGPWKSLFTPDSQKTTDVVLHQVHSNVTVFLMDLENASNLYIQKFMFVLSVPNVFLFP